MSSESLKIVEIVVFVTAIAFLAYSLFMQSAGAFGFSCFFLFLTFFVELARYSKRIDEYFEEQA